MKILAIHLKNLASLAGDYHIDFTAAPLANAGLFAITGPTGAGKSTVLDALCVALYGTTPRLREAGTTIRLNDISGRKLTARDPGHLLRRGCQDGYARVDFLGLDGMRYRAIWSVRRARATRGIPGQLKIDRQLIAADGEQLLNSSPGELDALIPEKTGLTFDQFTRAVLLAQSEFSAFLKASESERGELLEKLTNTGLYSDLGKAAYQRAYQARRELEQLHAMAGGMEALAAADRHALEHDAHKAETDAQVLQAQRDTLQEQLRWHETLIGLHESLQAAQREQDNARERWNALADDRDTLDWLKELLPRRHLFQERDRLLEAGPERKKRLTLVRQRLEETNRRLSERTAAEENARKRLADAERALRDARPALREAHQFSHEQTRLTALEAESRRLVDEQSTVLKQLETRIEAARQALRDQSTALESSRDRFADVYPATDPEGNVRPDTDIDPRELDAHLRTLHDRQASLQDYSNGLVRIRQTLTGLRATESRLSRLTDERQSADDELERVKAELAANHEAQGPAREALDTTLRLLERQRLAREATVEQLRSGLEPDTPCPVCGSTDHPYRVDDSLLHSLDALDRQEETRARDRVQQLEATRIRLETHAENLTARLAGIGQDMERLTRERQEAQAALARSPLANELPDGQPSDREAWCERRLEELQTKRTRLAEAVNAALEWQTAARERDRQEQALAALREQHTARREQYEANRQGLERCTAELERINTRLAELLGDHPSARAWEESLDQALKAAADDEAASRTAREETAEAYRALEQELKLAEQQAEDARNRLHTLESTIAVWRQSRKDLDDDRLNRLLALSEADTEALRRRVEQARDAFNTAEATFRERDRLVREHLKSRPTDTGLPELREQDARLEEEHKRAAALLQTLQGRLVADDQARERLRHLQERIDTQRAQHTRWARISDLIGSQDGRVFRAIAQAYNLDLLVAHANAQLRNLARRYRLKRGGSDLGLLVVDTDMGDEVRTVHSLSGGETFLVSLALALGLASMASGSLRIESLFIDEGFGSLDAESLQLAMDALDGLQAQGRKVGVISHVQDMHERVPVQIRVTPRGNGASQLDVR